MAKSRHYRKSRAGTKKRGRRGGFTSAVSPRLSQVQSQMPPPMKPVSPPPMKPVSPPAMKPVSPPAMKPVSPPPPRQVSAPPSRPVVPSNKSFKNTMQGHVNTATNAVKKGLSGALAGLSSLMGNASKAASSGGRKSHRRRTHKRRRSTRGFKKGTKSKTHRGRKNFTTNYRKNN